MDRAIRTSIDADHVLTIVMDLPGKPVNACAPQLLQELEDAVAAAEAGVERAI